MEWLNEPKAWSEDGHRLNVTTDPETDFWRKTRYGYTRNSGHFRHAKAGAEFVASVLFSGNYQAQFDQAGLMIRIDEANYIKAGIELVDGLLYVSTVVTREYSDWSTQPLKVGINEPLLIRATRQGDSVQIECSERDGLPQMIRLAYFPPAVEVQVGPMCCSPVGPGFDVTFEEFSLRS